MFEPPRYMTVAQAAEQILEAIDSRRKERNGKKLKCEQQCAVLIVHRLLSLSLSLSPSLSGLTTESGCMDVARMGTSTQCIASDSLSSISQWDLGGPLHSMVIVGTVHPLEEKMLTLAQNNVIRSRLYFYI